MTRFIFFSFTLIFVLVGFQVQDEIEVMFSNQTIEDLKSGDIIFQTSKSSQSIAIQRATKSKYSHMGIIYKEGKNTYVYEAVQPVKLTPLKK